MQDLALFAIASDRNRWLATRSAAVADNIANVNTTGYKRASTEFSSLILRSGTGNYNSGSVETQVRYAISDPGTMNYTT